MLVKVDQPTVQMLCCGRGGVLDANSHYIPSYAVLCIQGYKGYKRVYSPVMSVFVSQHGKYSATGLVGASVVKLKPSKISLEGGHAHVCVLFPPDQVSRAVHLFFTCAAMDGGSHGR